MKMSKDVAEEYTSSLNDLTVNSKPLINMLTMLAEDYIEHAPIIVKAVEVHLQKVQGDIKLPVLYLIDSIVKNVRRDYIPLFTQNLVSTFCSVFQKVDEKVKSQMFKLRQTWNEIFPAKKLYALDARINAMDPEWPITVNPQSVRIHVNPKFFQSQTPSTTTPASEAAPVANDNAIQEELLKQRKELLELQKKKVELELIQTKAILEERQKKIETQTTALMKTESTVAGSSTSNNPIGKPSKSKYKDDSKPDNDKPHASENTTFRTRDPRIRVKDTGETTNVRLMRHMNTTIPPNIKIPKLSDQSKSLPSSSKSKKDKKSKKTEQLSSKYESQLSDELHSSPKGSPLHQFQNVEKTKKENKLKSSDRYKPSINKPDISENNQNHNSNWGPDIPKSQILEPYEVESFTGSLTPQIDTYRDNRQTQIIDTYRDDRQTQSQKPQNIDTYRDDRQTQSQKPQNIDTYRDDRQMQGQKPQIIDTYRDDRQTQSVEIIDLVMNSDSSSAPSTPSSSNSPVKSRNTSLQKHKSKISMKKTSKKSRSEKRKRIEKEHIYTVDEEEPSKSETTSLPNLLANAAKDVDLRLLPSHSKPLDKDAEMEDLGDKSKIMDNLFGPQDVDLRTFPIQPPTPPPPPIISRQDKDISSAPSGNWANFKGTKPDEGFAKKSKKNTPGRSSFHSKTKGTVEEEFTETSEERTSDNCNFIIKQAEEQLNNGNITFTQYNGLLKAVMKMNEERKLQEAVRQDQMQQEPYQDKSEEALNESSDQYGETNMELSDNSALKRKYGEDAFNGENYDTSDDSMLNPDQRKRSKFHDSVQRSNNDRGKFAVGRFELDSKRPANPRSWPLRPPRPHMPPRGDFKRWSHPSRQQTFETGKVPFRYRGPLPPPPPLPPHINQFGIPRGQIGTNIVHLPPADPHVLDVIAQDVMKNIIYEGVPREIRFYGETAVIMLAWDDPREISFQPGSQTLIVDDREMISLQFNTPYQEFIIDGVRVNIRLGSPTRELYIDGIFYEVIFGAPPVQILFGGKMHSICMPGPTPQVKFSDVKRTDLVAGKVNLIIDANEMFPIYLDAKPQRFEIDHVPYILRFVEALQTVVINGVAFKIEFGGTPIPIYFQGEKHYIRLSVLPRGIVPGYITIVNMEGGRLPSPPPSLSPGFGLPNPSEPNGVEAANIASVSQPENDETKNSTALKNPFANDHSLELLASILPPSFAQPSVGQSYSADRTPEVAPQSILNNVTASTTPLPDTAINVNELLRKLVAVGIVPAVNKEKENEKETTSAVIVPLKPVDFSQPETLKVKQPALIARLYSGIQCSSCGVRFSPEETNKYTQHLDWHFRQNRRDRDSARIAQSRRWNYDVTDWIQYQEIEDIEERAQSWFEMQQKKTTEGEEVIEEEPSVYAEKHEDAAFCSICQDRFDIFYNEEKEEWHLRMAIRVDEKLYHPLCYKDFQDNLAKDEVPTPTDLYFVQEENETIEIVDDTITDIVDPIIEDEKITPDINNGTEKIDEENPASVTSELKDKVVTDDDSDDDILQIEVIEPQIESVEILDDEDDDIINEQQNDILKYSIDDDDNDEDTDYSNVVIKKEKEVVLPEPALVSHHTTIISSIDGNVELDDAPPLVQPKKISINITSSLGRKKINKDKEIDPVQNTLSILPGEDLRPASTKPKVKTNELTILPPVKKGTELSGLCNLM